MSAATERFRAKVEAWGGTVELQAMPRLEGGQAPSTVCLFAGEGPVRLCWHIKADDARQLAAALMQAADSLDAADAEVAK